MAPWGVAPRDIPFSFSVFMRWPVQADGTVVPMAAPSRAGDYADFLAEMDVVVANSACPSDSTPTNADNPTPMRFVGYEPGRCPREASAASRDPSPSRDAGAGRPVLGGR
jgi:uncharacterized protein YcgI (DUF1989 family)